MVHGEVKHISLLCFWRADQTQHGYWVICIPTHTNPLTPHTRSPTHLSKWTPTESICSWKVNYTLQVLPITHTHFQVGLLTGSAPVPRGGCPASSFLLWWKVCSRPPSTHCYNWGGGRKIRWARGQVGQIRGHSYTVEVSPLYLFWGSHTYRHS